MISLVHSVAAQTIGSLVPGRAATTVTGAVPPCRSGSRASVQASVPEGATAAFSRKAVRFVGAGFALSAANSAHSAWFAGRSRRLAKS